MCAFAANQGEAIKRDARLLSPARVPARRSQATSPATGPPITRRQRRRPAGGGTAADGGGTCLIGIARPLPMLSARPSSPFFSLSGSFPFRDCGRGRDRGSAGEERHGLPSLFNPSPLTSATVWSSAKTCQIKHKSLLSFLAGQSERRCIDALVAAGQVLG